MTSLPQLLDEIAETEDSRLGYTVTHNNAVTRLEAHTRETHANVVEAVQGALKLLEAVSEGGYSLINRADIGATAETDSYEDGQLVHWRGKVDVVLSPHF